MCKKTNYKTSNTQIDKCLRKFIINLNQITSIKILACCCGHGKYPMSIVAIDDYDDIFEMFSDTSIPRTRNFYKKDKQGYYYIPEVKADLKRNIQ